MRTVVFLLGIGFLELLSNHWEIEFKVNPFTMFGLMVFLIYFALLDWISVYWKSRMFNPKEEK